MDGQGHTRTNFADVRAFHDKFELTRLEVPGFLSNEQLEFRAKFMQEELDEFNDACGQHDLPLAADALIDLVYVAMGTADLMGIPWQLLWDEVQRANMSKVRARRATDSLRGSTFDVVKPSGWMPPNIEGKLEDYMERRRNELLTTHFPEPELDRVERAHLLRKDAAEG